jgi:WXG100 family type VII secretion target
MANSITVTTAELRTKAGDLRTKNSSLKTQIGNLETEESSLNSMWDGDANTAFHSAFTSDIAQMNAFYNAIENYCTALENIAQKYDSAESKNQSTASTRTYR